MARVSAKYDDVGYHLKGDRTELAAAMHIGLFFAWAAERGLVGELHEKESPEELARLRAHSTTGPAYLCAHCDGRLSREDLSAAGNDFASAYYEQYLSDLDAVLPAGCASPYELPNTWETYARVQPLLDKRWNEWLAGKRWPSREDKAKRRTSIPWGIVIAGLSAMLVSGRFNSPALAVGGAARAAVGFVVLLLLK